MSSGQDDATTAWAKALPWALACAIAVLSPLGVPDAVAQNDRPGFGDVVDVELVNVEVWVTDSRGRRITDLGREDFEVFEDGKPVEITHFTEFRDAVPTLGDVEHPMIEGPRGEIIPLPTASRDPGKLVLYFDMLNLRPANRLRLVGELRDFLSQGVIAPERVLILRQDEDLLAEAPFGSDPATIDRALQRLSVMKAGGASIEREKKRQVTELQILWEQALQFRTQGSGDPCAWYVRRARPDIEGYAREVEARISTSLTHLASTAGFLAGVPGVKTMLYLSDGLEMTPGADLQTFVNRLCPEQLHEVRRTSERPQLGQNFHKLTRHANANRLTIYSLQAVGLESNFLTESADQRGAGAFELERRSNERQGLEFLATETGGRTVVNRNRLRDELRKITDEMSTFYSLAYVPPHGGDGGEHKIDVKVNQEKVRVRHRRGYRDKNVDERMSERLDTALYLGQMSNPLDARIGAGEIRRSEKGKFDLPLHIRVPIDKVAFLPQEEGSIAHLKLQVTAQNAKNRKVAFREKVFRVEQPQGDTDLLDLPLDLEVGEGLLVLAVGLRDEATLEASYVSTTLNVP